jgi:putative two-component system response regulator
MDIKRSPTGYVDDRSAHVIVVDDMDMNRQLFSRLLDRHGYRVSTAENGAHALELIRRDAPDLILSDCMMPTMDGFELCRILKQDDATRLLPVVLMTGLDDEHARIMGIDAGADDFLRKPVNTLELTARVRSLIRLKRYTDDLDSAESMILSLARTVEARDPYTSGHCERMAECAAVFGAHLGLPPEDVLALRRGGVLHDIGKIALPDAILRKEAALTLSEFAEMKRHTVIGDELCAGLRLLRPVRAIVRQHHERLDGSGYPDGASGEGISLLAQIVSIVDVYDALTSDRPYRRATSAAHACAELRREVEIGWRRRDLVEAFIAVSSTAPLRHLPHERDRL